MTLDYCEVPQHRSAYMVPSAEYDSEYYVTYEPSDEAKNLVRNARGLLSTNYATPTTGRQITALAESYHKELRADIFFGREKIGREVVWFETGVPDEIERKRKKIFEKLKMLFTEHLVECNPDELLKLYHTLHDNERVVNILPPIAKILDKKVKRLSLHESATDKRDKGDRKESFDQLANQWRNDTCILSSVSEICGHPAYRQIIAMGESALPFIFSEMQREPNYWFWALKEITGVDPVPAEDRGDMLAMTVDWLKWARDNGH